MGQCSTHFLDTTKGILTLRAFGFVSQDRAQNTELLDASQRPAYLLFMIQQWLTLVGVGQAPSADVESIHDIPLTKVVGPEPGRRGSSSSAGRLSRGTPSKLWLYWSFVGRADELWRLSIFGRYAMDEA